MISDLIEGLVVAFTIGSIFFIVFGFIALMRYISYKEKKAIAEANGRLTQKEAYHE